MVIKVVHKNGKIETIALDGPIQIHQGTPQSALACEGGMDHYFDIEGYYDGWGMRFKGTMDEAEAKIKEVIKHRSIDP